MSQIANYVLSINNSHFSTEEAYVNWSGKMSNFFKVFTNITLKDKERHMAPVSESRCLWVDFQAYLSLNYI